MNRSNFERETIFNYNMAEDVCYLDTFDSALIRRMDVLASQNPCCQATGRGEGWAKYTFPKKWIKVRPPRELTEKQKAAVIRNLQKVEADDL